MQALISGILTHQTFCAILFSFFLERNGSGLMQKVAQGAQRAVYVFEEGLLLKIAETGQKYRVSTGFKKFLHTYFPSTRYRYMLCEIDHDLKIQIKARMIGIRSPIAPTRGLVQTQQGIGLLVQRIGKQETLGLTLHDFVTQGFLDQSALNELNAFAQSFFRLGVVAADINPQNIVWGTYNDRQVPYIVDGFGDRNFIKLRSHIRWFRNRTLHKGMNNTAKAIGLEWSRSRRMFVKP